MSSLQLQFWTFKVLHFLKRKKVGKQSKIWQRLESLKLLQNFLELNIFEVTFRRWRFDLILTFPNSLFSQKRIFLFFRWLAASSWEVFCQKKKLEKFDWDTARKKTLLVLYVFFHLIWLIWGNFSEEKRSPERDWNNKHLLKMSKFGFREMTARFAFLQSSIAIKPNGTSYIEW